MPSKKRLGDIVNFKRGYDLPSYNRKDGQYPIVSSAGISGYHSEYKVDGEGLVTGRYGTLGEVYYINGKYWPHNTALYVTDFKGNYPKYVYYLMKCLGNLKTSDKSTVPGINRNDLHEIVIPYIEPEFQKPIADCLFNIDAKIELNQRINSELESMAKSLYDYWFVQFDFPNEKGKPYKSSGGEMAWNEALKRMIPLGWEVGELGNYCQTFRGVTYKREEVKKPSDKNAIPILRATNISNGVIDLNDMVYVPVELVSEDQLLEKFDVLITMSSGSKAHVGKNAFYYFDTKVSFGAFCSKLSVHKNMRFYVNILMQSESFKKYISNVGLGTNINNLTNKHITEYKLLMPSKEQLGQYENAVEGFYNKISNNMKESQTLTELRDWLLPMLMNGQITVEDAEKASTSSRVSSQESLDFPVSI